MRSCATRSVNLYGPAHTGALPNLSPSAVAALGETIMPARSVSCAISGANGDLSTRRRVVGSTTVTESICEISARRNEPCIDRCRSRLNLAAAASKGSPSWNFTPVRSLMVTVLPSAEVSCESASCGTMLSFSSISKSLSQIDANTIRPT